LDILSKQQESGDEETAVEAGKEEEYILFFIGILIIHELGHLLIRWSGQLSSPVTFTYDIKQPAEAGFYLEFKLFESVVRLIIPSNPERTVWNKDTKISGNFYEFVSKIT